MDNGNNESLVSNQSGDHNFPVIGIVDDENCLLGFGTYGMFRVRPAYKYCIENSIYVHKDYRRKGLGEILLSELIQHAKMQNFPHYHRRDRCYKQSEYCIASQKFGFEEVGTFKQVGFKFDRWLDATFMQLTLPTPKQPNESTTYR